jgi:uncharacterized protein YjiS (DUF1127 family)
MDHLLPRRAQAGYPTSTSGFARRLLNAVIRVLERSRQRRALAQLSDELLRDIGLARADVARESEKSLWRP